MRLIGIGLLAGAAMTLAACQSATEDTATIAEAPATPESVLRPETGDTPQEHFASAAGDRVFFKTASSRLNEAARRILVRQAEWLKQNPELEAMIEGHADPRGANAYNQRLGQQRANAVYGYLHQLGVDPDKMRTLSYGETQRAGTGASAAELAKDRRVVAIIGAPAPEVAPMAEPEIPQAQPMPDPQPLTFEGAPIYRTLPTYNTFPTYSADDSVAQ